MNWERGKRKEKVGGERNQRKRKIIVKGGIKGEKTSRKTSKASRKRKWKAIEDVRKVKIKRRKRYW